MLRKLCLFVAVFVAGACAQTDPVAKPADSVPTQVLAISETISAGPRSGFLSPFRCDGDGNLYYRTGGLNPQMPLGKYDVKGQLKTSYLIVQTGIRDIVPYSFFVSKAGEVFQSAGIKGGHDAYVVAYSSDGRVASTTKVDLQDVSPYNLAVFPRGEFLIGGYQHPRHKGDPEGPLTVLLDSSGRVIRKIAFADDAKITSDSQANQGEKKTSTVPLSVAAGHIGIADDGNAYLLRQTSPAFLYAISPSGEIVRRIEIKSGIDGAVPFSMLINQTEAAILFSLSDANDIEIRVVDLTNGDVKSVFKPVAELHRQMACFNSSGFTFLADKDGQRVIYHAATQP